MKRRRKGKERLSQIIETHPQNEPAEQHLHYRYKPFDGARSFGWGSLKQTVQAGRAQNPILMLGDALPAKKSVTLRAAGNCFPLLMIAAAFETEFLHFCFPKGRLLGNDYRVWQQPLNRFTMFINQ